MLARQIECVSLLLVTVLLGKKRRILNQLGSTRGSIVPRAAVHPQTHKRHAAVSVHASQREKTMKYITGSLLFLCCHLSACILATDLDGFERDLLFTEIAIANLRTGTPLVGADVTYELADDVPWVRPRFSQVVTAAPTDSEGRTLLPVSTNRAALPEGFTGSWIISLCVLDELHTFSLHNKDGASAQTSSFSVRVVTTRSSAPPQPSPRAVVGTNPATIELNGYISEIEICDARANAYTWKARAPGVYPFLASVIVGQLPSLFIEYDDGIHECTASAESVTQGDAFEARIRYAGAATQTLLLYCSEPDGVVSACDP